MDWIWVGIWEGFLYTNTSTIPTQIQPTRQTKSKQMFDDSTDSTFKQTDYSSVKNFFRDQTLPSFGSTYSSFNLDDEWHHSFVTAHHCGLCRVWIPGFFPEIRVSAKGPAKSSRAHWLLFHLHAHCDRTNSRVKQTHTDEGGGGTK